MRFPKLCFFFALLAALSLPALAQRFSAWSTPVNLGPVVNTIHTDFQPFEAKDGLSLYFSVLENDVVGGPQDIWVAKRAAIGDPWGAPVRLGQPNSANATDGQAFVTRDGHWMLFTSDRAGGFGKNDIYISHRHDKNEDFGPEGWQEPVNLGATINTADAELCASLVEDQTTGVTTLYFQSQRASGLGLNDLYYSTLQPDGTFSGPQLIPNVNSTSNDELPSISRDGLTMYFISDRPGSIPANKKPSRDIWVSTRATTTDDWGTPVNLDVINTAMGGPQINSQYHDGRPSISFDDTRLYFFSAFREGNQSMYFDIWMTSRTKITGNDKH